MKSVTNKTFKLIDHIYHSDILVVIGEYEYLKKVLAKKGIDVGKNNKDFYAETGEIWEKSNNSLSGYYIRIPKIDFTNLNYSTIVHELTHLTYWILDRVGVEHNAANHESFAYLLEMFFSQFLTKAVKLYKKT